jgi:hypothetical protein
MASGKSVLMFSILAVALLKLSHRALLVADWLSFWIVFSPKRGQLEGSYVDCSCFTLLEP